MQERRKTDRVPYRAVITVDAVYNQEQVIHENREIPIQITDISRGGIGFVASEDLPVSFYFNAKIDLGGNRLFYSVLHIVRKEPAGGDDIRYGCEFTGLADILSLYIDEFQQETDME
jgi:c-di-GMP-binding flagellar brake protein YcgR